VPPRPGAETHPCERVAQPPRQDPPDHPLTKGPAGSMIRAGTPPRVVVSRPAPVPEANPMAHESSDDTVPCKYCRREIYEESARCPYCEKYISAEYDEDVPARKPWWLLVGVLLCLYAVYRWITLG